MLGQLRYQTRPPDETLVLHSGYDNLLGVQEDFPEASFHEFEDKQDWGHEKRAHGVGLATCEFLGFFNDDDRYERTYLERMLAEASMADVVYCNWNGNECAFQSCSSTSGNFIVRAELAKRVGYTSREYVADGHFINSISEATQNIVHVPEDLYRWNAVSRSEQT